MAPKKTAEGVSYKGILQIQKITGRKENAAQREIEGSTISYRKQLEEKVQKGILGISKETEITQVVTFRKVKEENKREFKEKEDEPMKKLQGTTEILETVNCKNE